MTSGECESQPMRGSGALNGDDSVAWAGRYFTQKKSPPATPPRRSKAMNTRRKIFTRLDERDIDIRWVDERPSPTAAIPWVRQRLHPSSSEGSAPVVKCSPNKHTTD